MISNSLPYNKNIISSHATQHSHFLRQMHNAPTEYERVAGVHNAMLSNYYANSTNKMLFDYINQLIARQLNSIRFDISLDGDKFTNALVSKITTGISR